MPVNTNYRKSVTVMTGQAWFHVTTAQTASHESQHDPKSGPQPALPKATPEERYGRHERHMLRFGYGYKQVTGPRRGDLA